MKDRKVLYTAGIIIASIILAIVGYFILPDMIAIQITLSGKDGNTVPKIIGLLIPFLMSVVFSILFYKSKNNKYLIVSLLGIVVSFFILFTNQV